MKCYLRFLCEFSVSSKPEYFVLHCKKLWCDETLLAHLWRGDGRFISVAQPVVITWRLSHSRPPAAAWGGLATDWVLRSTILVSAASQIIKRDGNLWHTVITSHLSAARAPLSGSQSLVTDTERHFVNWYV